MDIQMPDIDGLEATRRIRANRLFMNLPILAMTANVTDADKQMCLAAGMNGHVGKPFNLDELIETILQLTRRQVIKVAPSATKEDVGQLIESWESIMRRYRGKKGIFVSLLPQFEPEVSGLLEKLIFQFNAKNIAEMATTMHSIKGVAAAIGAAGLAKKTSMWELHLKTLEVDKLDDHFHAQDIDDLRDLLLQSLKALTLAMEEEK
jgi:CheY-like chemotaxis protein